MEIGVVFPQTEIGDDPEIVRQYAQTAETAGYDHILAYDHVLGVNPDRPDWSGPYDYKDTFHEVVALYGYLAGVTDEVDLVTGILILPQRQTALVAKQAAAVDVLSGGRLRLGVGVGWNEPEYIALNRDFSNRGHRMEESIEVLRDLWTTELVEFDGEFHTVPDMGIKPLPVQRPIPVWMGGTAEPVLRRAARLADGWFPMDDPGSTLEERLKRLREFAREADRNPDDIGVHGRSYVAPGDPDGWIDIAESWNDLGADYLAVNTMNQGLTEPEAHVDLVAEVARTLREAGLL